MRAQSSANGKERAADGSVSGKALAAGALDSRDRWLAPFRSVVFRFVLGGWAFLAGILLSTSGLRAESPTATLVDVQGQSHTGTLEEFTAETVTLVADDETRKFATNDLLEVRFDHQRIKPELWGAVIFLANGDRLVARPETIDETAALVRWEAFPSWKSVKVPLETITGMVLDVPEIAAVRSRNLRTARNRKEKTDLVDLKNGDQAGGEFLELTETTLRLNSPVGETPIQRDSIRLITMNRELVSFPKTEGLRFLFSLVDGSRITVSEVTRESEERLQVKTAFGAAFDLPLEKVISIRILGGRAVYLSDLEPAKYEHQPYLSAEWDLGTDLNVLGDPLRLDGVEYPKGLGMHSQSRVSYDLGGEYESFRSVIGLDDAADSRGSVVFAVEVDGKEVYRGEVQTGKDEAIQLPSISLAGSKQLTLRVEFAEFADVLDYADWCDAMLIR